MECKNNCMSCEHLNRDYCLGVKEQMKEYLKNNRDKKVNASVSFFNKNKISFEPTKTTNVVLIKYLGDEYYVSLKNFSFKKKGTSKWIPKKKQIIKLSTKMKFGKYKDDIVSDVIHNNVNYFYWIYKNTDYLISDDIKQIIDNFYKKNNLK